MKVTYQQIVVTNEVPRIGSGYRIVKAQHGNKWIHVTDIEGEGRTKLSQKAWAGIKKGDEIDPSVLLKSLRKADRALGRSPRKKLI